jgi:pyruvate dehydrogenase E1 component alpha subunit
MCQSNTGETLLMAKKVTVKKKAPSSNARLNDDIGEEKRLKMYRLQLEVRHLEQRAHDLFFSKLN